MAMKKTLKKPTEIPLPEKQPEIVPPAETPEPIIPMEDPPTKKFPEISPYDFPPPGEGIFPEIF